MLIILAVLVVDFFMTPGPVPLVVGALAGAAWLVWESAFPTGRAVIVRWALLVIGIISLVLVPGTVIAAKGIIRIPEISEDETGRRRKSFSSARSSPKYWPSSPRWSCACADGVRVGIVESADGRQLAGVRGI